MRLIDADALSEGVKAQKLLALEYATQRIMKMIDNATTIDAVPVVRGNWVQHYETTQDNEDIMAGWECTQCGNWEMEKQPYCHCGAKMEDKP